jgi:hypothetical protein
MPTNSCGGKANAELFFSISLRTPGAILQPHPPPCEREVSRVGDIGVFMNSNWIVTVISNYDAMLEFYILTPFL